jgi:hypothetical protein
MFDLYRDDNLFHLEREERRRAIEQRLLIHRALGGKRQPTRLRLLAGRSLIQLGARLEGTAADRTPAGKITGSVVRPGC